PVETNSIDPALVGVGIELEVPLHTRLIHHQRPAAAAAVAQRTGIVGNEPAAAREIPELVQTGEEESSPGHIPAEVVAAKTCHIETPAAGEPSRRGPLVPQHDMGVDLVS